MDLLLVMTRKGVLYTMVARYGNFREIINQLNDSGIVIAVNNQYQKQILELIKQNSRTDVFCI